MALILFNAASKIINFFFAAGRQQLGENSFHVCTTAATTPKLNTILVPEPVDRPHLAHQTAQARFKVKTLVIVLYNDIIDTQCGIIMKSAATLEK